jgi:hypothetical protein
MVNLDPNEKYTLSFYYRDAGEWRRHLEVLTYEEAKPLIDNDETAVAAFLASRIPGVEPQTIKPILTMGETAEEWLS